MELFRCKLPVGILHWIGTSAWPFTLPADWVVRDSSSAQLSQSSLPRSVRCKEGHVPGGCSVLNGDKAPYNESSCAGNIPNTPEAYECKAEFQSTLTRRDWRDMSRPWTETTGRRPANLEASGFSLGPRLQDQNSPGPAPCCLAAKACSSQFLAVRTLRHSELTLQSRRTPQTRPAALAKQSSQGWNSACDEPNSKCQDPRPLGPMSRHNSSSALSVLSA